jgi:hypothetical protein
MKRAICLLVSGLIFTTVTAQADITGEWYSADSSRIYKVFASGNEYRALLLSSSRPGDRDSALVLTGVVYHKRKDVYKGIMLAVSDSMPVAARISFADKQRRILRLRLRRMFVSRVNVWWHRRR